MKRNKNSNKGFTLVEMLGVLAIIAILISVIAVGVMSAINRARIVATVSNFKNLETAVVGFVALPNSGGTVPLTKAGPVSATPIVLFEMGVDPQFTQSANALIYYTLDQVLRASGLIDRPLSWRVGSDGATRLSLADEQLFILSRNAWAAEGQQVNGVAAPAPTNSWVGYNRCEVAPVSATALAVAAGAQPDVGDLISDADGMNFYLDGTSPLRASRVAYVVLENVSYKDAQKLSAELNGSLDDSEFAVDNAGQFRGRLIYPNAENGVTTVYYYLASF